MIEIIPNFHPIFTHFTVALFSTAFGFGALAFLTARYPIANEFSTVSYWCLWASGIVTIFTLEAGFNAYASERHDAVSHVAMTTHMGWALITATAIFFMAQWGLNKYFNNKKINILFLVGLLITTVLIMTTGWYGAEVVYRHGIGVISLPQLENLMEPHNTH